MKSYEFDRIFIKEVISMYAQRKSQSDIAKVMSQKYNVEFSSADIGEITRQENYWHTVKYQENKKNCLYILNDPLRKKLEQALNNLKNKNLK